MSVSSVTKVDTLSDLMGKIMKSDVATASLVDQAATVPAPSETPAATFPDFNAVMLERQKKTEIEKLLASVALEKGAKTESDVKAEIQAKISIRLGENEKLIRKCIEGLLKGEMTVDKRSGNVIPCKKDPLSDAVCFSVNTSGDEVVVWPSGQAIHIPHGFVYLKKGSFHRPTLSAMDLQSGKEYVVVLTCGMECEVQQSLKGRRGIDQICLHALVTLRREYGTYYNYLLCTESNNSLESLRACILTKKEISVIVQDLLYAILALEEEGPAKRSIAFDEINFSKVLLKRDPLSNQVVSACLGDFFGAIFDLDDICKQMQRDNFMQFIFDPLLTKLHSIKGCEKMTLAELCNADPTCQKLISEIEKDYREKKIDLIFASWW